MFQRNGNLFGGVILEDYNIVGIGDKVVEMLMLIIVDDIGAVSFLVEISIA